MMTRYKEKAMGGNYLIIDDPLKPDKALSKEKTSNWVTQNFSKRLNNSSTSRELLIIAMLHE